MATAVMPTAPPSEPLSVMPTSGLPWTNHMEIMAARAAAAGAMVVFTAMRPIVPLPMSVEPALKPNQPNQSMDAPIMVMVRLCGGVASLP